MGKKRIEEMLPRAIDIIRKVKIEENGAVASQYNGYIASFGASIVQSGLLATTAFFENIQSNSEKDRKKVTEAILHLIEKDCKENRLFDYLIKKDITPDLRDKIRDAAIALKLGLRTFKLVKNAGDDNGK